MPSSRTHKKQSQAARRKSAGNPRKRGGAVRKPSRPIKTQVLKKVFCSPKKCDAVSSPLTPGWTRGHADLFKTPKISPVVKHMTTRRVSTYQKTTFTKLTTPPVKRRRQSMAQKTSKRSTPVRNTNQNANTKKLGRKSLATGDGSPAKKARTPSPIKQESPVRQNKSAQKTPAKKGRTPAKAARAAPTTPSVEPIPKKAARKTPVKFADRSPSPIRKEAARKTPAKKTKTPAKKPKSPGRSTSDSEVSINIKTPARTNKPKTPGRGRKSISPTKSVSDSSVGMKTPAKAAAKLQKKTPNTTVVRDISLQTSLSMSPSPRKVSPKARKTPAKQTKTPAKQMKTPSRQTKTSVTHKRARSDMELSTLVAVAAKKAKTPSTTLKKVSDSSVTVLSSSASSSTSMSSTSTDCTYSVSPSTLSPEKKVEEKSRNCIIL